MIYHKNHIALHKHIQKNFLILNAFTYSRCCEKKISKQKYFEIKTRYVKSKIAKQNLISRA